jgi:hypothetical protein
VDLCPFMIASSSASLRITNSSWRRFASISNFLLPWSDIVFSIEILVKVVSAVYDAKVLESFVVIGQKY